MNKVENINIGGVVFHVDDDAYEKLKGYLRQINRHFKNTKGGDEIIIDIEARIVELFQQKLKDGKEVISLDDVNEVIAIMGKPSDFEEDVEEEYFGDPDVKQLGRKRLFRDIDNRMIGGVCSGLGAYFRLDPIWFRVAFIVATLSGVSILVYLILWLIIPPARTVSEKLEMNGDPVTIDNIEKTIREEMNDLRDKIDDLASQAKRKWRRKR